MATNKTLEQLVKDENTSALQTSPANLQHMSSVAVVIPTCLASGKSTLDICVNALMLERTCRRLHRECHRIVELVSRLT